MLPLLLEPIAQLTKKQMDTVSSDLSTYFNQYKISQEHIELIVFTVQTFILQNNRFTDPDGDLLVDKLGVAAKYFSTTIDLVSQLISADPGWYQPWLVRISPELEAHAKRSQVIYSHFTYLSEPPLHMQAWSIYAIVKSVEAGIGVNKEPAEWSIMDGFPAGSDEVLVVEFMSQLILRFLEYHRAEKKS